MNPTVPKSKNFDPQLVLPQSTIAGSFKSTARRAAFVDLSNTRTAAHHAGAGGPGVIDGLNKHAIPAPKATSKMVPFKDHNKENAVGNSKVKDTFLRPAQRPTNGLKPSTTTHGFPASNNNWAQPTIKQTGARKTTFVYNDQQQQNHQSLRRQHRSQPQLPKSTEAPALRRSASKQVLQGINHGISEKDAHEQPYEDAVHEQPSEEQQAYSWVPAPGPIGHPNNAQVEPLPPASATAGLQPLPSSHYIPEAEEYWDEEDDEDLYDEQGYTTAHSFRSYGDNTATATTLVVPKKTAKVQRELEAAKLFVDSNRPQEDIDEEEWDVSMVAEYGEEIFEYMRELEVSDARELLGTSPRQS